MVSYCFVVFWFSGMASCCIFGGGAISGKWCHCWICWLIGHRFVPYNLKLALLVLNCCLMVGLCVCCFVLYASEDSAYIVTLFETLYANGLGERDRGTDCGEPWVSDGDSH